MNAAFTTRPTAGRGRDRIIDAEKIGDREMTPIVAVPPGEEEIGGTACLAGIALRQREQAGERAVDLTVLDHHLRLRRHHALRHALHRLSATGPRTRSEEHTSELQSLMRISYAVFCLKKKNKQKTTKYTRSCTLNKSHHTHKHKRQ